jgi:hypothetical protein
MGTSTASRCLGEPAIHRFGREVMVALDEDGRVAFSAIVTPLHSARPRFCATVSEGREELLMVSRLRSWRVRACHRPDVSNYSRNLESLGRSLRSKARAQTAVPARPPLRAHSSVRVRRRGPRLDRTSACRAPHRRVPRLRRCRANAPTDARRSGVAEVPPPLASYSSSSRRPQAGLASIHRWSCRVGRGIGWGRRSGAS